MTTGAAANGLERKLGLFPLTNIVIANMIGAGIFTTSGLLMQDLHNPVVMLSLWLIGGLVALCGALSYGELGAAIPHAGGEYAFLSRLYHPILGFLSGWVSFFVGFSAPIAASAIGFSEYLTRAFPGLLHPGLFPGASEAMIMKKLYAILIIAAFTFLHTRGLEAGARVQNALTGLKILLIVGLVAAGFAFGKGSLAHLTAAAPFHFDFTGIKTMGLSLMWIMFAYSGWNASAYVGSEVRDPSRNLPRSLLLGTAVVIVLYAALNLFYVYAIPPAQMEGVISVAGLAAGNLFGKSAETVLSLLISFALFSSLSAYLILGPRVYYSMARDGIFFKSIARVDPRRSVPTRSIVLQGGIAVDHGLPRDLRAAPDLHGLFPGDIPPPRGPRRLQAEAFGTERREAAGLPRRLGRLHPRRGGHPRAGLPPRPGPVAGRRRHGPGRDTGLLLFQVDRAQAGLSLPYSRRGACRPEEPRWDGLS